VRIPLSPPSENKRVWERAKTAKLPGEMSEWLKEHGWKPCKHESASRVRIPLSPPVSLSAKCRGDVAQLGERLVRNEEVTGSIPVISTSFSSTAIDPRALESRRW